MRTTLITLLLLHLLGMAPGAALHAQLPDTTAVVEPLFTKRDAVFGGGVVLGAALLAPLDLHLAERLQGSEWRDHAWLRAGAEGFGVLGFPGSVLIAAGLYTAGRVVDAPELAETGVRTAEAIVVAEVLTFAGKALVGRARPKLNAEDPFDVELGRGLRHDDYQSFPSGHTSAAFATAAVLTGSIARHRPQARLLSGLVLYSGAALTGASRMYHNEHWASDVLVGAAIGSFSGWKVLRYHQTRPSSRIDRVLLSLEVAPAAGGGLLLWHRTRF